MVARQGDWLQVHYLNEGVMAHPMHLHGMAQTVIAKDGFPLPQPYEADTIMVGPGERYTVHVHATEVGTWAWHCHILSHAERADGMFGIGHRTRREVRGEPIRWSAARGHRTVSAVEGEHAVGAPVHGQLLAGRWVALTWGRRRMWRNRTESGAGPKWNAPR